MNKRTVNITGRIRKEIKSIDPAAKVILFGSRARGDAISALLYKHDINAKSHSGIKHQFGLHFVKSGLIDKSLAEIYIDLFDYSQAGDYADFVDFEKEKTLPLIPRTDNLLIKIEELIKEK